MRKRTYITACLLVMAVHCLIAQDKYANHWIVPDQDYIKIPFRASGVYRLQYKDIVNLPGAVSRPADIQVFQRGQEISKTPAGLADGRFNEGDYYEFFLRANQGEQDSVLYRPHSAWPGTPVNIYSDDSYIFVTVGKIPGTISRGYPYEPLGETEDFHIAGEMTVFADEWSYYNTSSAFLPTVSHSFFQPAEGHTGVALIGDAGKKERIKLRDYLPKQEWPVRFDALIFTRSNVTHRITASINDRTIADINVYGFSEQRPSALLTAEDLGLDNSFEFATRSLINAGNASHSWTTYKVTYPQLLSVKNRDTLTANLPAGRTGRSQLLISGDSVSVVYDVTDPLHSVRLPFEKDGENTRAYIDRRQEVARVYIARAAFEFGSGTAVKFTPVFFSEANYLILTHSSLWSSAGQYRDYRRSAAGGGYNVELVDVQNIYDQFNYGEKSPVALREFLRYQLKDNPAKDCFLLLIGHAYGIESFVKRPDRDVVNLVPAVGYPGSDHLLSTGLGVWGADVQAFMTGRIDATNNEAVLGYLAKVKEYESQPVEDWRKKILQMNGGRTVEEINGLKNIMIGYAREAQDSESNMSIEHLYKRTLENVENVDISRQVNEGVGFINFMGHGSNTQIDLNIGNASDALQGYNNKGRYPLMYFNGCGVGNIYQFGALVPLGLDWLITPDRGGIVVIANSHWSWTSSSSRYLDRMYHNFYTAMPGQPVGRIHRQNIAEVMEQYSSPYDVSNSHQSILQGDPAIVIFPFADPDYTPAAGTLQISSENGLSSLRDASRVVVSSRVDNLGRIRADQSVNVKLTLDYGNSQEVRSRSVTITNSFGSVFTDTLDVLPDSRLRSVKLTLDEPGQIAEGNEDNNEAVLDIDWEDARNYAVYPYSPYKDVVNPVLTVQINDRPALGENTYSTPPVVSFVLVDENTLEPDSTVIRAYIKSPGSEGFSEVGLDELHLVNDGHNRVKGWILSPGEQGSYELLINGYDRNGNASGRNYTVRWHIGEVEQAVSVSPNPASDYIKILLYSRGDTEAGIIIADMSGRVQYSGRQAVRDGRNELYLPRRFDPGLYAYQVTTAAGTYSGRVVVR